MNFQQYDGSNRKEPEPTNARPGTNEKIIVMKQRAERNQPLFHKNDGPRFVERVLSMWWSK
jgi:hypothetical protein